MTISDQQNEFAKSVYSRLIENDIRTELDLRNESLNLKIREAQIQKIPYMLVIGKKEMDSNGVSPRLRSGENLGFIKVENFIDKIKITCNAPQLNKQGHPGN
jgi:threonyl-tRNA synthetase